MIDNYTGRTWMYHPSGAKVELPLPVDPQAAFEAVGAFIAAGFTVSAPDLENVDRLEVAYVVRGRKTNDDGTVTNRIYCYAPWGNPDFSSQMTVYLNNQDDTAAFESAAKLRVADLPVVNGKAGPARSSGDFERNARAVSFSVMRRKVDVSEDHPNGRWQLVSYVGGKAPATNGTQQPSQDEPGEEKRVEAMYAIAASGNGGKRLYRILDAERKSLVSTFNPHVFEVFETDAQQWEAGELITLNEWGQGMFIKRGKDGNAEFSRWEVTNEPSAEELGDIPF